jgi:hypothetical protein
MKERCSFIPDIEMKRSLEENLVYFDIDFSAFNDLK